MATLTAIKKYFGIEDLKQFKQEWYELEGHERHMISDMVSVELERKRVRRPVYRRPRSISNVHMNGQMSAIHAPCNVQTVY